MYTGTGIHTDMSFGTGLKRLKFHNEVGYSMWSNIDCCKSFNSILCIERKFRVCSSFVFVMELMINTTAYTSQNSSPDSPDPHYCNPNTFPEAKK